MIRFMTMITCLLLAGPALAQFQADHCYDLGACPGAQDTIDEPLDTFFTYVGTNRTVPGFCGNAWFLYYNPNALSFTRAEQVQFNPEASLTWQTSTSPGGFGNCPSCTREVLIVWEDLFDNGFVLPVSTNNQEVRLVWQNLQFPVNTLIAGFGAEAEFVPACTALRTDNVSNLSIVPEPSFAMGIFAGLLALLALARPAASQEITVEEAIDELAIECEMIEDEVLRDECYALLESEEAEQ